ncbi:SseB family protein [Schaalia sp. ZJ405]|uniref:SseB family protein n=1 Tax=Schaalia sp. ZJ405 TaxID=2709403 RepID=UPI001E3491FE|nr:SseB family protein [Schaalia sp. ZJ405]
MSEVCSSNGGQGNTAEPLGGGARDNHGAHSGNVAGNARSAPMLSEDQRARLAGRLAMSPRDRGDAGQLLPRTREALTIPVEADCGASRVEALVHALESERLIIPILVEEDPRITGVHAGDPRESAPGDFVRVETDGGPALAAYSSARTLAADRPGARPTSCSARTLALTALVETRGRFLVDPGGASVLVPRPATAALAQGDRWLPAWKDPELLSELRERVGIGDEAESATRPIGVVDVKLAYAGEGKVRVLIACDPHVRLTRTMGEVRDGVSEAIEAIGRSPRLVAATDHVEYVPTWA